MGNICNNGHIDKQQTTETVDTFNKNYPMCEFSLKGTCKISLIMGTYRYHRSETLLLITQPDFLEYSPELRQYAQNYNSVIEQVSLQRKCLLSVNPNKNCPYKKIQLCILPIYNSKQSETYLQQFQNVIKILLAQHSDITLQLSFTSDSINGLPNQTLIALFVRHLTTLTRPLRLSILSTEHKLLHMVRYEVSKLQNYTTNFYHPDVQP